MRRAAEEESVFLVPLEHVLPFPANLRDGLDKMHIFIVFYDTED